MHVTRVKEVNLPTRGFSLLAARTPPAHVYFLFHRAMSASKTALLTKKRAATPITNEGTKVACRRSTSGHEDSEASSDDEQDSNGERTMLGHLSKKEWQTLHERYDGADDWSIAGVHTNHEYNHDYKDGLCHNSFNIDQDGLCDLFDARSMSCSWHRSQLRLFNADLAPAVVLSDEMVGRLGIGKNPYQGDRREFPGEALTVGVPLDDAEEFLKTLVHAHFLSAEEAGELVAAILAQKGATVGDHAGFHRLPEFDEYPADVAVFALYEANVLWPTDAAGQVHRWLHAEGLFSMRMVADMSEHWQEHWRPVHVRNADGSQVADGCFGYSWQCTVVSRKNTHVVIKPPFLRTMADPIGSFLVELPIRRTTAGRAVKVPADWTVQWSTPIGGPCDRVVSTGLRAAVARTKGMAPAHLATRRNLLLTDMGGKIISFDKVVDVAAVTDESLNNPQLVRFLLENPMLFSSTLTALEPQTPGSALSARVTVAIRPLAFAAVDLAPRAAHVEDLFTALQSTLSGPFLDSRYGLPIDVACASSNTSGEMANRIMDAVECHSERHTAEAEEPAELRTKLEPFQLRTLAWMREREQRQPAGIVRIRTTTDTDDFYFAHDHFHRRHPPRAGFLLQEMGLGKSVETLALVQSTLTAQRAKGGAGTLVICPSTLLGNWMSECSKLLPSSTSVLLLDTAARKKIDAEKLRAYDLVVASYATCKGAPVVDLPWYRLVLDESQEVKKLDGASTLAVAAICSKRRWALSGTPMPTSYHDLNGQFQALQIVPYHKYKLFNSRLSPMKNGIWCGFKRIEADATPQPLLRLLSVLAIRHCKRSQVGEVNVQLPQLIIEERRIEPRAEELTAYQELSELVVERLQAHYREVGNIARVSLAKIQSLLMKLRLACSHPSIARIDVDALALSEEDAALLKQIGMVTPEALTSEARQHGPQMVEYIEQLLAPFKVGESSAADTDQLRGTTEYSCPICFDEVCRPVLTACDRPHMYCLGCINGVFQRSAQMCKCPMCRAEVHKRQLRSLIVPPRPASRDSAGGTEAGAEGAKLEALITILKTDVTQHPKTVIFTHFAAAQSLICQRLKAEDIAFAQIAVGSSQRQRMKALSSFTSDPAVSIFVLSVKVASVGLTLTCASRLVLYEPGLNLAAEQQAIGRVYRFGQQRPVRIVKLALLQTVEIPILELNKGAAERIEAQNEQWQPPADWAADLSEEWLNAIRTLREKSMRSNERRGEQKTLDAKQLLSILGLSVDQLQ